MYHTHPDLPVYGREPGAEFGATRMCSETPHARARARKVLKVTPPMTTDRPPRPAPPNPDRLSPTAGTDAFVYRVVPRVVVQSFAKACRREGTAACVLVGLGLLVSLVAVAAAVFQGVRPSYFFTELRAIGRFSGMLTVVSGMCAAAAGILTLMISRSPIAVESAPAVRRAWTLAGLGMIVIGLDEITQLHEVVGGFLSYMRVPTPFGRDADMYVTIAYGIAALYVVRQLMGELPKIAKALPYGALVLLLYGFSESVDLLPVRTYAESTVLILAVVEELPKVLGSYCLLLFAFFAVESAMTHQRATAPPAPGASIQ